MRKKKKLEMIWTISPQTAIEELLDIEDIYVRTYSDDSLGGRVLLGLSDYILGSQSAEQEDFHCENQCFIHLNT